MAACRARFYPVLRSRKPPPKLLSCDSPASLLSRRRTFPQSIEDLAGAVSKYYQAPLVSFRNALLIKAERRDPGFQWPEMYVDDRFHPNPRGHEIFSDLAIAFLQQTAIDLIHRPFGQADEERIGRDLPPPMLEGNYEMKTASCFWAESLIEMVEPPHTGWEFVNEGTVERPRWGFLTTTAGSVLKIKIDSRIPYAAWGTTTIGETRRVIQILFLYSYQHMGIVNVTCQGCACDEKQIDAHDPVGQSSTIWGADFSVTQAEECFITLRVLSETRSGEHKFRLAGLIALAPSALDGEQRLTDKPHSDFNQNLEDAVVQDRHIV